jgi:hypothetical protein
MFVVAFFKLMSMKSGLSPVIRIFLSYPYLYMNLITCLKLWLKILFTDLLWEINTAEYLLDYVDKLK